ncbi:MAG: hypothetical protein ACPLZ8_05145 [Fervidicoccaceae archaeon]
MDEIKKGFVQTSSVRAILATTKINREKVAEEEIGSMMISKKISYRPNPIHFSGGVLFLTETSESLHECYFFDAFRSY